MDVVHVAIRIGHTLKVNHPLAYAMDFSIAAFIVLPTLLFVAGLSKPISQTFEKARHPLHHTPVLDVPADRDPKTW
jgi:hypothetical protein